jgi:prepilin-type processing-associated H-X9-DG protein
MSLVEILTVIGVIAVLIAILLPGLATAQKNAILAKSQNNLRQIATFMTAYAQGNRETIVPAAFDYSAQLGDPRMRARTASPVGVAPPIGAAGVGSWADILWTENKLGPIVDTTNPGEYDWRYDAPDRPFYEINEDYDRNPFRSAARITKTSQADEAVPYGNGSALTETGHPGYFACNEFFDLRPADATHPNRGKWWVNGQILRPAQSVYLIDSFAGEVTQTTGSGANNLQWADVDYRYVGDKCLMLFLDGHVTAEDAFDSLRELEEGRQIRAFDLDRQKPFFAN